MKFDVFVVILGLCTPIYIRSTAYGVGSGHDVLALLPGTCREDVDNKLSRPGSEPPAEADPVCARGRVTGLMPRGGRLGLRIA